MYVDSWIILYDQNYQEYSLSTIQIHNEINLYYSRCQIQMTLQNKKNIIMVEFMGLIVVVVVHQAITRPSLSFSNKLKRGKLLLKLCICDNKHLSK